MILIKAKKPKDFRKEISARWKEESCINYILKIFAQLVHHIIII